MESNDPEPNTHETCSSEIEKDQHQLPLWFGHSSRPSLFGKSKSYDFVSVGSYLVKFALPFQKLNNRIGANQIAPDNGVGILQPKRKPKLGHDLAVIIPFQFASIGCFIHKKRYRELFLKCKEYILYILEKRVSNFPPIP